MDNDRPAENLPPLPGDRAAAFIGLEALARRAETPAELGFIMANRTRSLLPAAMTILWRREAGGVRLAAVSGITEIDRTAGFVLWLETVIAGLAEAGDRRAVRLIAADDVPDADRSTWTAQLPRHGLWLTLCDWRGRNRSGQGGLLLLRDHPWTGEDAAVGGRLADAYAHAWAALNGDRAAALLRGWRPGRRLTITAAVLAALCLLVPVDQSILAPAVVVPLEPTVITAPMDGVVETVTVEPNQTVTAGQVLVRMDATMARNRFEVAERGRAVAEAEFVRVQRLAFSDPDSKARTEVLRLLLDQRRLEAQFAAALLERATLVSPVPGLAVFEDASPWQGRPVATGQKIMIIADPARVALEIALPVGDAIALARGAAVVFFPNIDPLRSLSGTLRHHGFEATPTPEGLIAYRLLATLDPGAAPPPIGAKGTVKLFGDKVLLAQYLFRRPISWVRQSVGW